MGILARWGGLSPFLSSTLPRCTHGPMQLFIFSYWGCSIHWLSHLLCSIGVRQHLFGERNVAFHWQSSKNAEEIIKLFKGKGTAEREGERLQTRQCRVTGYSAVMSISTHHLDTTKWRSVWITHNARKWSRDPIRRSFIRPAFLTETPCRTMKRSPDSCKMRPVLQPHSSWAQAH